MRIILILIFVWYGVNAKCDMCQNNGAACTSSNSYQLCFGGSKPYLKQTFKCLEGMVCTNMPIICFQSGGWTPSCGRGDLSRCGVCNSKRVFACTSRTTFSFCFGSANPTNINGTCPGGYICNSTSNFICVPQGNALEPTCDSSEDT